MENGFISNVNILAGITEVLQNIHTNIETIKNVEDKSISIDKIVSLENQLNSIYINTSDLLLISDSITKLINVSNSLNEIEQVNDNYDDFFFKYDEARNLLGKFRVELDSFFSSFPEVQNMYDEIVLKNESINKNILLATQSAVSASTSAGVAVAAKVAIEDKYEVYLDATQISDEVVIVAGVKNEIVALENDLTKIISVFNKLGNIDTVVSFQSTIENLAANIQDIKDAITITTDAKNVTNQNAQSTTSDKNLAKQYKDESLSYRNTTLNLKDETVKAVSDMTSIVNQINRQTASNSKLAFAVHAISTNLSIEYSNTIVSLKEMLEDKEIELNIFAKDLTQSITFEIANAKTIVSRDVQTSQKIVSDISRDLSLLLEAKHRENKNEIRFNNSELVSLISVAKNMFNNKIIHEDATDIKNDVNTSILLAKEDITDFKNVTLEDIELAKKDALNLIDADVQTSQEIVSQISDSLHLLTEAKHRENKNEIRFKNSELVSLLAVSKIMIENKIISEDAKNQILEFEIKLKENDHEKIKNLLNSFTTNQRVELLVAKSLLTDIKLQTL